MRVDVVFANPAWIHGVWAALALVGLLAYLEFRRNDALARFVSTPMQVRLAHGAPMGRRALKLALVLATLLFGIVALMRPQTPGGTEAAPGRRAGADVMVVLDVSRSMLAEDAAPNTWRARRPTSPSSSRGCADTAWVWWRSPGAPR